MMRIQDFEIERFIAAKGGRYALFCEGSTPLKAAEMAEALLRDCGFDPFLEHYFPDGEESYIRRSVEATMLRAHGKTGIVLLPGLSHSFIRERNADESLVVELCFKLAKQASGITAPVIVPVHTVGLPVDARMLGRAFAMLGFVRIYADASEADAANPTRMSANEMEAAIRMTGIVDEAESILSSTQGTFDLNETGKDKDAVTRDGWVR